MVFQNIFGQKLDRVGLTAGNSSLNGTSRAAASTHHGVAAASSCREADFTCKPKKRALSKFQTSPIPGGAPPCSSRPTPIRAMIHEAHVRGFTPRPDRPAKMGTTRTCVQVCMCSAPASLHHSTWVSCLQQLLHPDCKGVQRMVLFSCGASCCRSGSACWQTCTTDTPASRDTKSNRKQAMAGCVQEA